MRVSRDLVLALIAQNQNALWRLGSAPPFDPGERERWERHRASLMRELNGFWLALAEG